MRFPFFAKRAKPFAEVSADEAIALVARGAVLVDVRTGLEFNSGHANGARHIPLELVARRAAELPADADVVVICQSGHRSALAARSLAKRGFTVSSVLGGTPAWKRAGGAMGGPTA
ncbi:MAG: rhodanese-like domain-containing protein [Pseudolysinimonas sp.]